MIRIKCNEIEEKAKAIPWEDVIAVRVGVN